MGQSALSDLEDGWDAPSRRKDSSMSTAEVTSLPTTRQDGAGEPEEAVLSLVLFSGTDDRLTAAAVLVAGAAAMGRRVNILLQYWALEAFRKDRIREEHGMAPEAAPEAGGRLQRARAAQKYQHWADILGQAKEIGEVSVHACALTMDVFGLSPEDLDPLVDGVEGVAAFMLDATGPVVFI
jgi:peroxiredoxin family protein